MMKYGVAMIAGMVLLSSPALAAGDNPFSRDTAVLDLRGLDLASVDGQQRLEIRMAQAADAVCGTGMATIHIALGEQARVCREDVKADIRTRIAAATALRETASPVRLARR